MEKFEILIAAVPDREKLVAEIWLDNIMIAEISQENDKIEIELYYLQKKNISFNFEDFINVLQETKTKLLN